MRNAYLDDIKDEAFAAAVKQERDEIKLKCAIARDMINANYPGMPLLYVNQEMFDDAKNIGLPTHRLRVIQKVPYEAFSGKYDAIYIIIVLAGCALIWRIWG